MLGEGRSGGNEPGLSERDCRLTSGEWQVIVRIPEDSLATEGNEQNGKSSESPAFAISGDVESPNLAEANGSSDARRFMPGAEDTLVPVTIPFAWLGIDDPNSSELHAWLESMEFYRDIHYSSPRNTHTRWKLERDEYLLLGDNSAVSIDARDWNPPAVSGTVMRRIQTAKPGLGGIGIQNTRKGER